MKYVHKCGISIDTSTCNLGAVYNARDILCDNSDCGDIDCEVCPFDSDASFLEMVGFKKVKIEE